MQDHARREEPMGNPSSLGVVNPGVSEGSIDLD